MVMTTEELRSLDAFIAEHVMGWQLVTTLHDIVTPGQFFARSDGVFVFKRGSELRNFHPTTDPAAAMEVLKKCGEELYGHGVAIEIRNYNRQGWTVMAQSRGNTAETIELAICYFAKQLFTKDGNAPTHSR